MEPIHQAADDGDLASINELLQGDGGRLNARARQGLRLGVLDIGGCTPLMLAASQGHDAVVARLLALGADLKAWASVNERAGLGTPLILAASQGSTNCVALLIARGGGALELDVQDEQGQTALHCAAGHGFTGIVGLLLLAGADPTLRDNTGRALLLAGAHPTIPSDNGSMPIDWARRQNHHSSIALLEAALAEPQRPRLLLKARTLVDAGVLHRLVTQKLTDKRLPPELQRHILALAFPAYLTDRVERDAPLPRATVQGQDVQMVACVEYALRGMGKGLFVELCEMITPKWARTDM